MFYQLNYPGFLLLTNHTIFHNHIFIRLYFIYSFSKKAVNLSNSKSKFFIIRINKDLLRNKTQNDLKNN